MSGKYKSFGYIDEPLLQVGFLIPIFKRDNDFYYQELKSKKIKGFEKCREIGSYKKFDVSRSFKVNDSALFCFKTNQTNVIVGTFSEIRSELLQVATSLTGKPFLKKEIASFLGDSNLLEAAENDIKFRLSDNINRRSLPNHQPKVGSISKNDTEKNVPSISLRSFQAIHEPEICERFNEGHVKVLRGYGINPISPARRNWFSNPAVYGVILEMEGKIIGGVKLHKVGGTQWLPMEEGIGYLDERLFDIVKKCSLNGGAGEVCGLWQTREVVGWGLSLILMQSIISISTQVKVTTLLGLSSDHTLKLFESLGYKIINTLGNKGDFVYPTPDYLTKVIKMNAKTMSGALPYNKERVRALRAQPNQSHSVISKTIKFRVNYKLLLPTMAAVVDPA